VRPSRGAGGSNFYGKTFLILPIHVPMTECEIANSRREPVTRDHYRMETLGAWLIVRDSRTISPWRDEDTVTPHSLRPPGPAGKHMLVHTVECLEGCAEVELICVPSRGGLKRAGELRLANARNDGAC
jgi:hypothetical protein